MNNNFCLKFCSIMAVIFYALFSIKKYFFPFYVPDYFLYHAFNQRTLNIYDGFSSLFVLISRSDLKYAAIIHLLCFILIISAFGIILYTVVDLVSEKLHRFLAFLLLISGGFWYFFFGKLYYDFPFGIFSLAAALFFLRLSILQNQNFAAVLFFWLFLGFTLSWKPYFLFGVLGIISLVFLDQKTCQIMFNQNGVSIRNIHLFFSTEMLLKYFYYFLLILTGFLIGNFTLLYKFSSGLKGLAAYPAQSSFFKHLFQNQYIWDIVNGTAVNLSVFFIPSAIIILFIIPLFIKNKLYLFSSCFFSFLYFLFITFKSPGYPWHFFMFGVYIILFGIFLAREREREREREIQILFAIAVLMQIANNFLIYLPRETIWFKTTVNIITDIRSNSEELNNLMHKAAAKLKNKFSYYTILQRKTIINDKPTFAEFADIPEDKKITAHPLYTGDLNEAAYLLVLYPQALKNKNMQDVFQPLGIEEFFQEFPFVIGHKKVSLVETIVYKNFHIEILKFQ